MGKRYWKIRYWLKGVYLGMKGMGKIQLGSRVFWDGKWWFVINNAGGPYLVLTEGRRHGSGQLFNYNAPIEAVRPSKSVGEFIHRFRTMYRWYMGCWWTIDVYKATIVKTAGGE